MGDLVFVNLPEEGDEVNVGDSFADVESVKAVSDVYAPVSGVICEVNEELLDAPEKMNEAPYDAWLVKVKDITEKEELLTAVQKEDRNLPLKLSVDIQIGIGQPAFGRFCNNPIYTVLF